MADNEYYNYTSYYNSQLFLNNLMTQKPSLIYHNSIKQIIFCKNKGDDELNQI